MQVKLSMIKSSPQPVRSSQDEQKMVELTQSIKEHGLLQAVKVRPIGDEFEVVFGHRRVEACRRLELTHIEAVTEELNDFTTLVQALIENVVREDLGALDKARGLKALKDATGWSNRELERQGIVSNDVANDLMALLREPEEVQQMLAQPSAGDVDHVNPDKSGQVLKPAVTLYHLQLVRPVKLSEPDRIAVLNKAAREGLTAAQTRSVADAFKRVENNRLAKLNLSELPVMRDHETLEVLVGHRTEKAEKEEAKVYDNLDDLNVKAFAEAISTATTSIRAQWQLVDKNLIGAEHMPYLAKRLRLLAAELNSKADKLDEKRAKEVDA